MGVRTNAHEVYLNNRRDGKMQGKIERLEQDQDEKFKKEAEDLKRKYSNWSEVYENFQARHEISGNYMIVKIIGIPHEDVFNILCNYILAEEYYNTEMRLEGIVQVKITDKKISTNKSSESCTVVNNINFEPSKIYNKRTREKGLLLRMFGD